MLSADVCQLFPSKMLLQPFPAGLAEPCSWTCPSWRRSLRPGLHPSSPLPLTHPPLLSSLLPTLLAGVLPSFSSLSLHLRSSLRPSTSLARTPVATLKTAVAMVTAVCCGNVKEPNPPRINSPLLFLSLQTPHLPHPVAVFVVLRGDDASPRTRPSSPSRNGRCCSSDAATAEPKRCASAAKHAQPSAAGSAVQAQSLQRFPASTFLLSFVFCLVWIVFLLPP